MTSSWFLLSTLNYDARSTTHHILIWFSSHVGLFSSDFLTKHPYVFLFPAAHTTGLVYLIFLLSGHQKTTWRGHKSSPVPLLVEESGKKISLSGDPCFFTSQVRVLDAFAELRKATISLQPGHYSSLTAPNLQPTANQERNYQCGNQHYSRELLMMGIVVPETCWATIRIEIKNSKSDI